MPEIRDNNELDPKTPVTNDDVEAHGIEEDETAESAEALTVTGVCIDPSAN